MLKMDTNTFRKNLSESANRKMAGVQHDNEMTYVKGKQWPNVDESFFAILAVVLLREI